MTGATDKFFKGCLRAQRLKKSLLLVASAGAKLLLQIQKHVLPAILGEFVATDADVTKN